MLGGCLLGFLAITTMVATNSGIVGLDDRISAHFAHTNYTLYRLGFLIKDVVSPQLDTTVLVVTGVIVSLRRHSLQPLVAALWAAAICIVVVLDLKYALHRGAPPYGFPVSQGEFPSGHAACALVMLTTAVWIATTGRTQVHAHIAVLGLAFAVSVALIYDRMHWFSDVLGSVLLAPVLLFWIWLTPAVAGQRAWLARQAHGVASKTE